MSGIHRDLARWLATEVDGAESASRNAGQRALKLQEDYAESLRCCSGKMDSEAILRELTAIIADNELAIGALDRASDALWRGAGSKDWILSLVVIVTPFVLWIWPPF
jgi:hypothetical protein